MLLILFGILTESSIGALFIAGILPGILLAAAFSILNWVLAHRFPNFVAVGGEVQKTESLMGADELVVKLVPIVILIFIVLGGIWLGWFTATEAGGIGAFAALMLSILKRTLTWANLWQVLKETGHVTAAICFLLISAHLYSKMIVVSGIPGVMEGFIQSSGLGPGELLAIYHRHHHSAGHHSGFRLHHADYRAAGFSHPPKFGCRPYLVSGSSRSSRSRSDC